MHQPPPAPPPPPPPPAPAPAPAPPPAPPLQPEAGTDPASRSKRRRSLHAAARSAAIWTFIGGVLWAVFLTYRDPDLMFTLASQVWGCF